MSSRTKSELAAENAALRDRLAELERRLPESPMERELTERTRQLEAVRAVSEEITRELDLISLLNLIHRRAAELVGPAMGRGAPGHRSRRVDRPSSAES